MCIDAFGISGSHVGNVDRYTCHSHSRQFFSWKFYRKSNDRNLSWQWTAVIAKLLTEITHCMGFGWDGIFAICRSMEKSRGKMVTGQQQMHELKNTHTRCMNKSRINIYSSQRHLLAGIGTHNMNHHHFSCRMQVPAYGTWHVNVHVRAGITQHASMHRSTIHTHNDIGVCVLVNEWGMWVRVKCQTDWKAVSAFSSYQFMKQLNLHVFCIWNIERANVYYTDTNAAVHRTSYIVCTVKWCMAHMRHSAGTQV